MYASVQAYATAGAVEAAVARAITSLLAALPIALFAMAVEGKWGDPALGGQLGRRRRRRLWRQGW